MSIPPFGTVLDKTDQNTYCAGTLCSDEHCEARIIRLAISLKDHCISEYDENSFSECRVVPALDAAQAKCSIPRQWTSSGRIHSFAALSREGAAGDPHCERHFDEHKVSICSCSAAKSEEHYERVPNVRRAASAAVGTHVII